MVKSLNTTRSDLIRKAVIHYRTLLEKERPRIRWTSF